MATDFLYSNLNSGDYIGQKLRENSFDPKGKGTSTMLDDLVKTWELIWSRAGQCDCTSSVVRGHTLKGQGCTFNILKELSACRSKYFRVVLVCNVLSVCRLIMTLPLALRFGGWTKKRDGMYLTETSCKLLVFLETKDWIWCLCFILVLLLEQAEFVIRCDKPVEMKKYSEIG